MIDTHRIFQELSQPLGEEAAHKLASTLGVIYADLKQTVTKDDFAELKGVVARLAEAQAGTETHLERLSLRVEELAQAQARTESQVEQLAHAQASAESAVKNLAASVEKLVGAIRRTNQQVGALSHSVGYTLENESYKALPALLKRDHGIEVQGRLTRKHVEVEPLEYVEMNILGQATRNGKPLTIVGEAKTQLHLRDLHHFLADRVEPARKAFQEVFPVLVTHMTATHDLEEEVRKAGVALYYSYDLS